MKHGQMLKLLEELKKPFVEYSGSCVAGFDLDVATAEGGGTACWAWGSTGVEGPDCLPKKDLPRIEAALESEEEPADFDSDQLALYRAMIHAKCEPDVPYFHILESEDGDRFFSKDYDAVHEEWVGSAVMVAELTPWSQMEDDELEEWIEKIGLKPAPKPKSARAKPSTTSSGK